MLTEIALTPQVFEEASNPDADAWVESLHALGHGLFPMNAAPPMVVSDLFEGAWIGEARKMIGSIRDHRVRDRVQRIVSQLKSIAVPRPAVRDWPADERGWAEEAVASSKFEPIARIVLTNSLHDGFVPEHGQCHCLADVESEERGFWNGIRTAGPVPMDMRAQVSLLRPICVHAQYLTLTMPHVRGGDDDETEFVVRVIDSAFRRPAGFSAVFVELHVNADRYAGRTDNLIDSVRHSLAAGLPSGTEVRLYLWPKFTERLLIAGGVKTSPGGEEVKYPRWGVSFGHIARRGDELPATRWQLVPRDELADLARLFDPKDRRLVGGETVAL